MTYNPSKGRFKSSKTSRNKSENTRAKCVFSSPLQWQWLLSSSSCTFLPRKNPSSSWNIFCESNREWVSCSQTTPNFQLPLTTFKDHFYNQFLHELAMRVVAQLSRESGKIHGHFHGRGSSENRDFMQKLRLGSLSCDLVHG